MKKIIIYMLVFVMLTCGLVVLTGCGTDEETTDAEGNNEIIEEDEEKTQIVTTGEYTKWPSGVYGAYGIPEFTQGTIGFAEPYSENGTVYINTDLTSLRSYIYMLTAKDFRISDSDMESLKEYNPMDEYDMERGITGTIYAPTQGAGYTISYSYSAKGTSQNVPAYSFENITEDYTFESNCYFSLSFEEYPEENIEKDLFTKYGLADEDILPKFKIYTAEKDDTSQGSELVTFDFGYDACLSEEEIATYRLQLANSCEKASDDGKIYDYNGENVIASEDDKKATPVYVFKYQGTEYRVISEMNSGFCERGIVIIEVK